MAPTGCVETRRVLPAAQHLHQGWQHAGSVRDGSAIVFIECNVPQNRQAVHPGLVRLVNLVVRLPLTLVSQHRDKGWKELQRGVCQRSLELSLSEFKGAGARDKKEGVD